MDRFLPRLARCNIAEGLARQRVLKVWKVISFSSNAFQLQRDWPVIPIRILKGNLEMGEAG